MLLHCCSLQAAARLEQELEGGAGVLHQEELTGEHEFEGQRVGTGARALILSLQERVGGRSRRAAAGGIGRGLLTPEI